MARAAAIGLAIALAGALAGACEVREPSRSTYFGRAIAPTLTTTCTRSPTGSGCHVADARGNAFGNLDTSEFDAVDKRRDLLVSHGPYDQPGLLLKVLPPLELEVRAYDGAVTRIVTDVRHTGGSILDPSGTAYQQLRRWIDNGATENNSGKPPSAYASLPCAAHMPSSNHDLTVDPPAGDFDPFRTEVQPVLLARCGSGNCHGSAANQLALACGSTPEELRANYWAAVDYLADDPGRAELLRRPMSPSAGGTYHGGGVIFASPEDADYQKLLAWANRHGPPELPVTDGAFDFFAHRVQPVLVRKGCMQLQCHSTSIFHDYRLRGGASGSFSLSSTRKNYELSLEQLALESEDVTVSRLVRKNLFRPETATRGGGIVHRGGPLFEDFAAPATAASCADKGYDYDAGDLNAIPAMCVIGEWLHRERAARPTRPLTGIVYVSRALPDEGSRILDFDVYAKGSDLRIAAVTAGPDGALVVSDDRSVAASCGLSPDTADIKRPHVAWDGETVAFAARTGVTEPLRIYEMAADGSSCGPIEAIGAHPTTGNGLLIHDFDPAYSPPLEGGGAAIVFASTRGNLDPGPYDYAGPQRTPADPSRPNANLYVYEPDPKSPGSRRVRQLTYLLNTERAPSFMADGRVIFTVEKRLPGFSQISLRRINLDGGDYHPLFGQRGSLGYHEVSQVVHLADRNFAAIFADRGAPDRGGALGIFNRSIGVDVGSADPRDYPADPSVADPSALAAPDPAFFLHSLHLADPAGPGLYAAPSPLPDGRVLVSHAAPGSGGDYDLYVVDPVSGARARLAGATGRADVEAVAVYGRPLLPLYRSGPSQPNAYAMDESRTAASVTMHDARMILSIMTQNTPTGRRVDPRLESFDVWEDLPPPLDVTRMDQGGAFVVADAFGKVHVRRRRLGTVPIAPDGSARWEVTGGLPLVFELPETEQSRALSLPRFVSEHVMFTPGESVHEALRRSAFDGFCAGCHGSVSGRPLDAALQPDVLSRASDTAALHAKPAMLVGPPSERGPIVGP